MRYLKTFLCFSLFLICVFVPLHGIAQNREKSPPLPRAGTLTLVEAVMCEGVKNHRPYDDAIVFSFRLGSVFCFTDFNPVPRKGVIIHKWFRRETLRLEKKLLVNPPRWSTYSKILLRKADKGPWRVEITDQNGTVFKTLRFSITD